LPRFTLETQSAGEGTIQMTEGNWGTTYREKSNRAATETKVHTPQKKTFAEQVETASATDKAKREKGKKPHEREPAWLTGWKTEIERQWDQGSVG